MYHLNLMYVGFFFFSLSSSVHMISCRTEYLLHVRKIYKVIAVLWHKVDLTEDDKGNFMYFMCWWNIPGCSVLWHVYVNMLL